MNANIGGIATFRRPSNAAEWKLCQDELAALLGEAAGQPEWLSRMVLSLGDNPRPLLTVDCPAWLSAADVSRDCPWMASLDGTDPLATETRAFGMVSALELLRAEDGPEKEIAYRRGRMQWKREQDEKDRASLGAEGRAQREREAAESELRMSYGLTAWEQADPGLRALVTLGEIIGSTHPGLAVAIREAVAKAGTTSASPRETLPRSQWWKRPEPAELAAAMGASPASAPKRKGK